jgi:hypothetical protein
MIETAGSGTFLSGLHAKPSTEREGRRGEPENLALLTTPSTQRASLQRGRRNT